MQSKINILALVLLCASINTQANPGSTGHEVGNGQEGRAPSLSPLQTLRGLSTELKTDYVRNVWSQSAPCEIECRPVGSAVIHQGFMKKSKPYDLSKSRRVFSFPINSASECSKKAASFSQGSLKNIDMESLLDADPLVQAKKDKGQVSFTGNFVCKSKNFHKNRRVFFMKEDTASNPARQRCVQLQAEEITKLIGKTVKGQKITKLGDVSMGGSHYTGPRPKEAIVAETAYTSNPPLGSVERSESDDKYSILGSDSFHSDSVSVSCQYSSTAGETTLNLSLGMSTSDKDCRIISANDILKRGCSQFD